MNTQTLVYNYGQTGGVFNPITTIGTLQVDSYLHNSLALNFVNACQSHDTDICCGTINKPHKHTPAYNVCPLYRLTHGNGIALH